MSDQRLLDSFLEMVRIYSPSCGERQMADYVDSALQDLGAATFYDDAASVTGGETGNLIGKLPGTRPGLTLVFSAHLDCVEPCKDVQPVVRDGVVTSSGETVLGADNKAGVAAILESVRRVVERGLPRPDIRMVFTVAEEKGLRGAKALDPSSVAGDLCIVLDADGSVGGIVTASPTHYTFFAEFRGKAAHAGVQPEKGTSALLMVSRAMQAMSLGRLDEHTTANVGTVSGGTATNVVPAYATMTGECRSIDPHRAEEVRASMDTAIKQAARKGGGRVEVAWTKEYDGFSFSDDDPSLRLVVEACGDVGVAPRLFATGGGSDGNIISALGVPTLVLSCGMNAVHGPDESLTLADLAAATRLLEAVIARAVGVPE